MPMNMAVSVYSSRIGPTPVQASAALIQPWSANSPIQAFSRIRNPVQNGSMTPSSKGSRQASGARAMASAMG